MDCSCQAPLSMGLSRQEYQSGLPSISQPRDRTHVSSISCIGKKALYHWHELGSPLISLWVFSFKQRAVEVTCIRKAPLNLNLNYFLLWFRQRWVGIGLSSIIYKRNYNIYPKTKEVLQPSQCVPLTLSLVSVFPCTHLKIEYFCYLNDLEVSTYKIMSIVHIPCSPPVPVFCHVLYNPKVRLPRNTSVK